MNTEQFKNFNDRIVNNCNRVIVGKDEIITQVVISLICGGHVLLEDVPGTGKTMLCRAFAKSIGGDFNRVQFTPDLLPSDLTGINFFSQKTGEFEFRKGPVFTNMLLADEINRATPRTQSALLESMEERQVSVDGVTYRLDEPFMVMATQNPIESYGTFPLPEAQLDRFFMRLSLGYMTRNQELDVIARPSAASIVETLSPVVSAADIEQIRGELSQVRVSEDVANYLLDIVQRTRDNAEITTGVSTRGAIALYRAAQAYAAINGRDYVIPEDVRHEASYVIPHRLSGALGRTKSVIEAFEKILGSVTVPLENV